MRRFSKVKEERIRKNLDEAFEAVKVLIEHPEQIDAMPDESVIVPVRLPLGKKK